MGIQSVEKIAHTLNQALEQKKTRFHFQQEESTWFLDKVDDQVLLGLVGTRSPLLSILERVAQITTHHVHATSVGTRVQLSIILPLKACTPQALRDGVFCLYRIAHES